MTNTQPEWQRLQKALSVEADRGFNDIQGSQYRFSEFLGLSLRQLAGSVVASARDRARQLAAEFDIYPQKYLEQRQHLIAITVSFLRQMEQVWEQETRHQQEQVAQVRPANANASEPTAPALSVPRTVPLSTAAAPPSLTLDQQLTRVTGIGPANGNRLVKLGLYTVYDLLYYYPRNHIDYAKQVQIRELVAGETVTLIAEVKRCNCFSSPKNKKLTILEVILKDR
ncbi:DNA helicase RecG, partial [Microcoleus sp. HI-ES]|nr:DNA helicase RecG [Microcoleus sp. HI-ES]MCZ0902927.1 DNA helicase RecG [Microcoleus sp. HI-ES]